MFTPKQTFKKILMLLVASASIIYSGPSRENQGLYGGKVLAMAYDELHSKMFAAVEGPLSLFTSSNYGKNWEQSFPDDSLEIVVNDHERYGWGGRALNVISSGGITVAITMEEGGTLYSTVFSTDGENWTTLWDPRIAQSSNLSSSFPEITQHTQISSAAILNGTIFLASGNVILTTSDTAKTWGLIPFPDSSAINGTVSDTSYEISYIEPISADGQSFYVVAKLKTSADEKEGLLFKTTDGITFTQLSPFVSMGYDSIVDTGIVDTGKGVPDIAVSAIWVDKTHPDTVLLLEPNPNGGNPLGIYYSFDGCDTIYQAFHAQEGVNISDMIVAQDTSLPGPDHIRILSGISYSDDLGKTWTQCAGVNVGEISGRLERLLLHVPNTDVYAGVSNDGPQVTEGGIDGTFEPRNYGMASLTVYKIAQRLDQLNRVYLATASGLAFTSAYGDSTISDSARWAPPYGMFPITPDLALSMGAVAISPYDSMTVIAASGNGMYKTTDGGYTLGAGEDWSKHWAYVSFEDISGMTTNGFKNNGGRVIDIEFYSEDTIFAALRADRSANSGCLLQSFDGGTTWKINADLPQQATNDVAISYDSTTKEKVIWVGTGMAPVKGRIYKSTDGGTTWDTIIAPSASNNSFSTELPIRSIITRPNSLTDVVFGGGDNTDWSVSYTTDGGDSVYALSGYNGGVEIIAGTVNKNNTDSVFFAQRNKIIVVDFSMTDTTKKDTVSDTVVVNPEDPQISDYFTGLPGEIFKDVHYDDLAMTSSVGFFNVETGTTPIITKKQVLPFKGGLYLSGIYTGGRIVGIRYSLDYTSNVKIDLYNIAGQKLSTLVNEKQKSGIYRIFVPARIASGVYVVRLKTDRESLQKNISLVK